MRLERHAPMGKTFGFFYHLDDGRVIYLAHKKKGHIYRERNAWCFETQTLDYAKRLGVYGFGVVINNKKDGKLFWFTRLEDMYDVGSFVPDIKHSKTSQRGLPLSLFRIDPTAHAGYIAKAIKIK